MRKLLSLAVTSLLLVGLGGCEQQPTVPDASPDPSGSALGSAEVPVVDPHIPVVEATATSEHAHDGEEAEHRFVLDRTEIPAGWTTFRFRNEADVTHFMVLQKLPPEAGDITRKEYIEEVSKPAQKIVEGEAGPGILPSWVLDPGPTTMGGPGLTAGGHTSATTVKLTPGRYVAECYVRDEDTNVLHHARGMVEVFTVTGASSGAPEPTADVEVEIATAENGGIEITSSRLPSTSSGGGPALRPGAQTIAVHFEKQTSSYPGLSGHDVHIVRLEAGADLDELNAWMFYLAPGGMRAPTPSGTTFLGGTQQMPEGETAYVTTVLPAGSYALIAEVPDPEGKDMLETFTVPSGPGRGR